MGEHTTISWTDHTFNIVWGCTKISPGCKSCYAEALARRAGLNVWGKDAPRKVWSHDSAHWREPRRWNRAAIRDGVRRRVFCPSMADVFEDHPALPNERASLWILIESTPALDWLLLTKRPENILQMVPQSWLTGQWPGHVWIGTSVEDQQRAEARIPELLQVPARVRFLSLEPLLEPLDLSKWLPPHPMECGIHWVIVGGESGPMHRPMDLAWARKIRDQCKAAGVAFFFKQTSSRFSGAPSGDPGLDGCKDLLFICVQRGEEDG